MLCKTPAAVRKHLSLLHFIILIICNEQCSSHDGDTKKFPQREAIISGVNYKRHC